MAELGTDLSRRSKLRRPVNDKRVSHSAAVSMQGGGCTTVGLAGLLQGGGFGSFSKHYGTAAASLLEAEVVTADGQIRIANACTNPDLFWALKGGGGGTFGVISKITLKLHDLPEYFCVANFTIKAPSDDAYRRLVRQFVSFYRKSLFNDHWGEQARLRPDNSFEIQMLAVGLDSVQAKEVWQPFLDWVRQSPEGYSLKFPVIIAGIPARHFWDVEWWKSHWAEAVFPNPNGNPLRGLFDYGLEHLIGQPALTLDPRPDAPPNNAWWKGNTFECGWFIRAYQSLWLPESLLGDDASQQRLADALYAASRHSGFELHFNKGLAGVPPDAIAAARDTCTNPAVLTAFTLVIAGDAEEGPAYPGIPGYEPSLDEGRKAAERVERCMNELRAIAPNGGGYVSESNFFEKASSNRIGGATTRGSRRSRRNTIRAGCSSCTTASAPSSGAPTASPSCESPQRWRLRRKSTSLIDRGHGTLGCAGFLVWARSRPCACP